MNEGGWFLSVPLFPPFLIFSLLIRTNNKVEGRIEKRCRPAEPTMCTWVGYTNSLKLHWWADRISTARLLLYNPEELMKCPHVSSLPSSSFFFRNNSPHSHPSSILFPDGLCQENRKHYKILSREIFHIEN